MKSRSEKCYINESQIKSGKPKNLLSILVQIANKNMFEKTNLCHVSVDEGKYFRLTLMAVLTRNPPLSVFCVGMALGGGVCMCVYVYVYVCVCLCVGVCVCWGV